MCGGRQVDDMDEKTAPRGMLASLDPDCTQFAWGNRFISPLL